MKEKLKKAVSVLFEKGQHFGVDILPRHFYSEVPDLRVLRSSDGWRRELSLSTLNLAPLDEQVEFLKRIVSSELATEICGGNIHQWACDENGAHGYGQTDADVLYAFVKSIAPRRIVQVGCGVSTAICLRAIGESGFESFKCVEPYPNPFLKQKANNGEITLIDRKIQDLPSDCFSELEAGDLLFIDSSHTLGPAGEVTRMILNYLPHVKSGVFVHFHDIWLPFDYPPDILDRPQFFWHETALLTAFLSYNMAFRVECSLSLLHHKKQEAFRGILPNYIPARFEDGLKIGPGSYPCSIYLSRR